MKKELENELYNIDPVFFRHAINCKTGIENAMTTCMYWGCECGDGWFKPLKKFIQKVAIINELGKKYNIQFVCDQLKEKWGELTVYYSSAWADESNKNLIDIDQCNILEEMFEEADNINSPEAQEIRDTIYSMLMENGSYFRKDFGGMFDSDDDIESEINEIIKRVKNGQDIEYVKQPTSEFDEKLRSLVDEYIRLGGRDDIKSIDA